MGEYARFGREEIKIGTCENMYYLRADQARQVVALPGNVDPVKDARELRFRFPFPDEDGTPPGAFDNYARGLPLDVPAAHDVEHHTIQFRHELPDGCFLASLPCPYSKDAKDGSVKIHANPAPRGTVQIVQQRLLAGLDAIRMLVVRCSACGSLWRVPTLTEALPYVEACVTIAQREMAEELRACNRDPLRVPNVDAGKFWRDVAARIVNGYEHAEKTAFGEKLLGSIVKDRIA